MTGNVKRMIAGVSIMETPLVAKAVEHAREQTEPYLFNHAVRSWLFAIRIGQIRQIEFDAEVVALGTLLHDITLKVHPTGIRRFEVEGADLARAFAIEGGVDMRRAQLIWDSVALNSTPSIGLFKEAEVALCTAGICLDVVGLEYKTLPESEIEQIVEAFPRLGMKRRMTRCFCQMVKANPGTTYDNFLRDFGERFVPGYQAPSSVDLVSNTPFSD